MSTAIYAIAFDCENAAGLAQFWSQLIGAPLDADPSEEFASIGLTDGTAGQPGLVFNKVPEGKAAKNRVHLDLVVTALDEEVDRALAAGADKIADFDDSGGRWVTLADPEGNEFDFVAAQD
jgi:predicted enzyme related to lactoylglutathione lyase